MWGRQHRGVIPIQNDESLGPNRLPLANDYPIRMLRSVKWCRLHSLLRYEFSSHAGTFRESFKCRGQLILQLALPNSKDGLDNLLVYPKMPHQPSVL